MKHSFKITLILIGLFLAAQIIGLFVINQYKEVEITETGEINVTYKKLPSIAGVEIERPKIDPSESLKVVTLIAAAIIIGTIILLLIIKFKQGILWRLWFFLAVGICLTIAFGAFINNNLAFVLGFMLAYFKTFRPGIITHNLSEMFIYGGLAAIFVPMLNKSSVFVLLVLISLYDMYAVWKSKHMIKLAKFQAKAKIFAGMLIPYKMPKIKPVKRIKGKKKKAAKKIKIKTAILGGGDIGFPLLFAGVIMETTGLLKAMIIPVFVTASLLLLLMLAKKDRFYPAMPFLSIGCIAGYAAIWILDILILLL